MSNKSAPIFLRRFPYHWLQTSLFILILIFPQVIKASGCEDDREIEYLIAHSDLIFYGKALSVYSVDDKKNRPAELTEFKVLKHYKGPKYQEIRVLSSSGIAGDYYCHFKVGEESVVFARIGKETGQYTVSSCAMWTYRKFRVQYDFALEEYRRNRDAFIVELQRIGPNKKLLREQIDFLIKSKDLSEADNAYTELLKISPSDETALVERGNIRYEMKRYGEALPDYLAAIAMNGQNREALRGKAFSLIMLGRAKELGPSDRDFSSFDGGSTHSISFAGLDLGGANFRDAKISIVDFSGANLQGADFSGARLSGADFSGANLDKSNFTRAQLSLIWDKSKEYQTTFNKAKLEQANFTAAWVSFADFSGTEINNADFSETKLEKVSFKDLVLQSVNFKKAFLYGVDFSGADLSGKDLSGLEMQGSRFVNAKLNNANLTDALFSGPIGRFRNNESLHGPGPATDFRGTDLTGAKLEGADLRYAIFNCNTRWPAGFQFEKLPLFPVSSQECTKVIKTGLFATPPVLRETPNKIGGERAQIRGPQFLNQQFPGINLSEANLSGFQFWRINFSGAKLVGTDLRNADLQGTDFSGADLSAADLTGATLWGVDFSEAILDKTILTAAEYDEKTLWPKGFDPVKVGARKGR